MARHLTISRTLGVPVYFCGSRSLTQRGNNENMTRLVRDYLPARPLVWEFTRSTWRTDSGGRGAPTVIVR